MISNGKSVEIRMLYEISGIGEIMDCESWLSKYSHCQNCFCFKCELEYMTGSVCSKKGDSLILEIKDIEKFKKEFDQMCCLKTVIIKSLEF